ncbi:flagella synthesis protein FlgN [Shewanella maritima]|uniref:flagella synthesis protein FlgN n=1 Tax=Shewanella maritima TaxID=2520507 RepID=UPI003736D962
MTELQQMLSSQHATLASLRQIISAEKQALIDQDADKLLDIAAQKQTHLSQLETQDKALAQHPEHTLLASEASLVEQVQKAKKLLQECKELNQQNANLIELSMASINRFTQALQASRNSSSMTYDDKGKTSTISTLGSDFKA